MPDHIPDLVKDHAASASLVGGAILTLVAVFKVFRGAVSSAITILGSPWTVTKLVMELRESYDRRHTSLVEEQKRQGDLIDSIRGEVKIMSQELQSNGLGSIKDVVNLLGAKHKADFAANPTPMFICDLNGMNKMVSQGYLDFVGVRDEDELHYYFWEAFIDQDDLDDYREAWNSAFQDGRTLIWEVRWRDAKGNRLGSRIVRAEKIGNFYLGTLLEPRKD